MVLVEYEDLPGCLEFAITHCHLLGLRLEA